MRKLVIFLPIVSAFWFITTILLGGFKHSNYQHKSQFISELGATGEVNAHAVNLFGFVPTSIFLCAFVCLAIYLSSRQVKQILGLLGIGVYAITLAVAALYPCDSGCNPDNPSTSQMVHDLSAIFGYLSGIVGVYLLASDVKKKGGIRLGTVGYILCGLTIAMFLLLNPEFSFVGLAQRVFELSMYTWIILYSFHIRAEIFNKSRKVGAVDGDSS